MWALLNNETHTSECILCYMATQNSTTVSSHEATTMPYVPTAGSCVTVVDHFFQFSRLLDIINEFRKLPNHFCLYFKRTFLMGKQIANLESGHKLAANYYRTTF